MPWLQIHVRIERPLADRAESLLEGLGALSVTFEDAADQPLLEPGPGETPLWDITVVTGLFEADIDIDRLHRELDASLSDTSAEVVFEALEDQPWERAWLDHFHPMRFGQRLWICPHGHQLPASAADDIPPVIMHLDPGLAFGTGTHPTTALCLEWLEQADLEGKLVIDYGCGSGILGIAALLLGAARVIAIDHDPQALTATQTNAQENGVSDRITTCLPERTPTEPSDIVVANILAGVLVKLAGPLTDLVKPGGRLVLAGILDEQAAAVVAAYDSAFSFAPAGHKEGWALLTAHKG